jgi:hypothetical protein
MHVQSLLEEFGALKDGSGDGFFYKARSGEFDLVGAERALFTLNQIAKSFSKDEYIKVAKAVYEIPFLLRSWRDVDVKPKSENEKRAYDRYTSLFWGGVHFIMNEKY